MDIPETGIPKQLSDLLDAQERELADAVGDLQPNAYATWIKCGLVLARRLKIGEPYGDFKSTRHWRSEAMEEASDCLVYLVRDLIENTN